MQVRVGGSFVWPPPLLSNGESGVEEKGEGKATRVVFIAGGVGINPLMSIVSHLEHTAREAGKLGLVVKFFYTTRDPGPHTNPSEILFLERLISVFDTLGNEGQFQLFLTSGQNGGEEVRSGKLVVGVKGIEIQRRRIHHTDLLDAFGPIEERKRTICYICGIPAMTDEFVEKAKNAEGMNEENVLSEKWW